MISVPCNICGDASQLQSLWTVPDRHWAPNARFDLVRCKRCGLVYLNPRPDATELERHYPSFTFVRPPLDSPSAFSWRLQQIEKYQKRGKILDVGCGNGGFLAFIQQKGWNVYGLDNAPAGVSIAKELLGDRVLLTTIDEASYPSNHFDVVCLFEVLEHLPDPLSDLREINRILRPGGLVCISVPNFASWERVLFGKWWNGLDAPRHLYQFTPCTLQQVMTLADFTILELKSVNASQIQVNRSHIDYCRESLRFFLRDVGLYPHKEITIGHGLDSNAAQKGKESWKRGFNVIENIFLYPFWLINRIADRDNTLSACGQKRGHA